jgi:hypothetical protein
MVKRRKILVNGAFLMAGTIFTPFNKYLSLAHNSLEPIKVNNTSKRQILNSGLLRDYLREFNSDDNELYNLSVSNDKAFDFLENNIPFFECPDKEIEKTYYFRWWTFRKHLKETIDGWVITEFLPEVSYAGKHNTICCPAGHHFREGRWLHSRKFLDDYSVFWLRKGGDIRSYSFWAADSIWNYSLIKGDFSLAVDLLPDLVSNYLEWEKSRKDPNGLYWQHDVRDGMEVSISGSGYRSTINSYQFGDAMAITNIAKIAGQTDVEQTFRQKALTLRILINKNLWDDSAGFYKVGIRTSEQEPKPAGILSVKVNDDAGILGESVPSASVFFDKTSLSALKNSQSPSSSADTSIPKMTILPRKGETEWVQYDFTKQVTVSSLQVYWSQDAECRLPREWRLFYRKNNDWYPVPARIRNRIYPDTYNLLTMDPITTSGLKVEIVCQGTNPVVINQEMHLTDVRELHGYTPWYFDDLPENRMAIAWNQLIDKEGFYAPFGPTSTEQRHPGFRIEYIGHACQWNGPSWPFSTSITLTALANQLNCESQNYIGRADYFNLLRNFALSHRIKKENDVKKCWIDENLNPYSGEWLSRAMLQRWGQKPFERGKDYNHSTFCDLIINGLVGVRPQIDDRIIINPLIPENSWDWFCLDGIPYHGRWLTVLWDKTGDHYRKGKGMILLADGQLIAHSTNIQRLEARLPNKSL